MTMRRRFGLVLLLLLVAAAVEIAVAVAVAHVIGWPWTLFALLAVSVTGGWLLRREGGRAWRTFRADAEARRAPGNSATDGLLVLAGGVFMVVPGFVSGAIGLLLLLPPTRYPVRRLVQRLLTGRITPAAANSFFGPRPA
jgi:UPF0716 protein FxsA